MTLKYVPMENFVVYEDNYIIFIKVSEDEWNMGTYCYHVQMYRPYLVDNNMVKHPFAYRNAKAERFARRLQFGFTSFIDARTAANNKANQYIRRFGDG